MDDLDNQTEEVFQGGTTDQWRDYADTLQVSVPEISLKDATTFVASMTPVIGDAMAAKEVYDELKKDEPNYYLAGALGGATIVGLIPGVGDAAAKAIRTGAKEVFDVAKRIKVDPNTLGSTGGNISFTPKAANSVDEPKIISFTKKKEEKDLKDFKTNLMSDVQDIATKRADLTKELYDTGYFDKYTKGVRVESKNSKGELLPPYKITGYSLDKTRLENPNLKRIEKNLGIKFNFIEKDGDYYIARLNMETPDGSTSSVYLDALKQRNTPIMDGPKEQSVWSYPKQLYDSADTSINVKLNPAGYNELKKRGEIKDGDVIVDIGGGRFDNLVQDAAEEGATVKVYDPFNRTPEHNSVVVDSIKDGQADMAMSHNVLNVIQEDKNIIDIALQAENAIKPNGKAHFSVYEGTGKGEGKVTTKGYQRNEKTAAYVPLIEKVFGEGNVTRKGKIITATKNVKEFNEGGTIMDEQTRMAFALGGSVDLDTVPDNTKGIDPVSGNEVPIGSTPKEVRDDIPAQLSEGEYVVPSDVVRFYGVRFFENLRAKAKFGYKDMADNGRIGGEPVDEPDMDMMFDVSELDFEDDGEPMAMADGGYALSPGDEGYATMGALGLGSEGITAGYGSAGSAPTVEVRTYVNEAGHTIYITFINGEPQTSIPPGYTLQEETTADTTTTAATTAQPEPQVVTPRGRDRSSTPMPTPKAINYKELTTEEISKMLEDQTSAKSTAISIGAGAINPVLGLLVKGAMMDSARRLENEIERRIASEEYAGDKQVLEDMLKASKEGKPGLIQKIFGAVKDAFVPETQEEADALEIAMQMDTGDVTQFEGDINLDVDPIIKTESTIPTEAEVIAPTTGKVSTYVDPVTREETKFESYGQVTRNGVYAGDGFEWYKMEDKDGNAIKSSDGSPVLGRRYTKEGEDNGLGQDTIIATELGYGQPEDRDTFIKIAEVSMEEGSEFASNKGSANDGDWINFITTGSFKASDSFAAMQAKEAGEENDYSPTLTYGDALEEIKAPEVKVEELEVKVKEPEVTIKEPEVEDQDAEAQEILDLIENSETPVIENPAGEVFTKEAYDLLPYSTDANDPNQIKTTRLDMNLVDTITPEESKRFRDIRKAKEAETARLASLKAQKDAGNFATEAEIQVARDKNENIYGQQLAKTQDQKTRTEKMADYTKSQKIIQDRIKSGQFDSSGKARGGRAKGGLMKKTKKK